MVERKPSKFKVTGSSPVFCAEFNVSCLYPQCSVTVAREIVALLEKVRLLPCGPIPEYKDICPPYTHRLMVILRTGVEKT